MGIISTYLGNRHLEDDNGVAFQIGDYTRKGPVQGIAWVGDAVFYITSTGTYTEEELNDERFIRI